MHPLGQMLLVYRDCLLYTSILSYSMNDEWGMIIQNDSYNPDNDPSKNPIPPMNCDNRIDILAGMLFGMYSLAGTGSAGTRCSAPHLGTVGTPLKRMCFWTGWNLTGLRSRDKHPPPPAELTAAPEGRCRPPGWSPAAEAQRTTHLWSRCIAVLLGWAWLWGGLKYVTIATMF